MDKEPKKKENGPLSILLMVAVGLFVLAVFLGFFVLWVQEGWSDASQKNPVGGAMFFIALGITYLIAIPILKDKGYRALSNVMLWLAVAAGGLFMVSHIPSCNNTSGEFPLDRP